MRNGGTSRKNLPYYSITLKVSGQEEFLWEDKEGVMVGGKTTPEPEGSGVGTLGNVIGVRGEMAYFTWKAT